MVGKGSDRPDLYGLHEAHDARGPIPWDDASGDETSGVFERRPDYVRGADGKTHYREATITIYEDNFDEAGIQAISNEHGDGSRITRDEAIVAVLLHEIYHDVDTKTVSAIRDRLDGKPNPYPLETRADDPVRRFLAESPDRPRPRPPRPEVPRPEAPTLGLPARDHCLGRHRRRAGPHDAARGRAD